MSGDLSGSEEMLHELSNLAFVARYSAESLLLSIDRASAKSTELAHDLVLALDSILELIEEKRASEIRELPDDIVNLNDIIQASIKIASSLLDKRVRLSVSLSPDIQRIRLNRSDGMRLILNVLLNAIEACDVPAPVITIRSDSNIKPRTTGAECVEFGQEPLLGSTVHLEIRDNGIGVPRATLRRIFEPRFSTKGSRGTGLGLVIVQSIIDRSGGYLRFCSVPAAGTCVDLYFPSVECVSVAALDGSNATHGHDA